MTRCLNRHDFIQYTFPWCTIFLRRGLRTLSGVGTFSRASRQSNSSSFCDRLLAPLERWPGFRSDQIGLSLPSPHASTCGMGIVHTLLTRRVTDSPARVVSELSSSRIRGIGVERGRADCLNEERMGTYQQPGGANEQQSSSASSVISAMELGLSAARSFNLVWGMGRRRWVSINSFEWRSRAPPRPTHDRYEPSPQS